MVIVELMETIISVVTFEMDFGKVFKARPPTDTVKVRAAM
jgi:hypothetical protein